jgi:hypothetical protein
MDDPLAQRMLDLIYRDGTVRRKSKDALSDWILDTQSWTEPLNSMALVEYLACHQPDLLDRLKTNVRLQEDLMASLVSVEPK